MFAPFARGLAQHHQHTIRRCPFTGLLESSRTPLACVGFAHWPLQNPRFASGLCDCCDQQSLTRCRCQLHNTCGPNFRAPAQKLTGFMSKLTAYSEECSKQMSCQCTRFTPFSLKHGCRRADALKNVSLTDWISDTRPKIH